MTDIVPVPPAPEVPPFPPLGAPNFNQQSFAWGVALPGVSNQIHAVCESAATNAIAANERAMSAAGSAAEAAEVKTVVMSAVNFKGYWENLSGPLNMPATVKHLGRFWLLTRNVSDVTVEVPGVSTAWTSDSATASIQEVTSSRLMSPGVRYVVMNTGVTLTVPDSVTAGDYFSAEDASDDGFNVAWSTHTVKGQIPVNPMKVPKLRGFSVTYTGSTFA